jgi:photosystem II stability/assembly factor-like uncharacterized protein
MKTLIFVLSLVLSLNCLAQNADWIQQSPPITTQSLQDIAILSPGVLVAVGGSGTIIKSTDGGETWAKKTSPTYNQLNAVDFITQSIGFACGNSSTILKTTDGGESWVSQTSNTNTTLYSIDFVSPDTGWVSGYNRTILKTTDGGVTWISQFSTSTLTFLEDLTALDRQKVFIAGWGSGGDFYKTTDGGQTWNGSDMSGWAKGVDFINDLTGWIAGITASYISVSESWGDIYTTINGKKSTIWKTTNGGGTWTPFVFPIAQWLYDVTLISPDKVFAVGEKGLIISTTDGGLNWTQQSDPKYSTVSFNAVSFESASTGYIVGDKGTILKTNDGGITWKQKGNIGTTNALNSVFFINDSTGWAAGYTGAIVKTINGGKDWIPQISGVTETLLSVFFADSLIGWCAGNSGRLLSTTNGGTTWTNQTSGITSSLYSIYFIDKNNGWAVGDNGNIIHTSNGGLTWTGQTSATTASLYTLFFINSSTGWAAGSNGTIVKTTNGGQLWTEIKIKTSDYYDKINDLIFIDENTGWCIGDWILKTTNGGQTWVKQFGNMSDYYNYYDLNSVFFTDSQTGWISAHLGKVLKTTNGGTTWGVTSTGNNASYYDICFKNSLTGWVVGYDGYIMKTNTGGGSFTPMEFLSIPKLVEPSDWKWYVSGNPKLKWNSLGTGSIYEVLVTTNGIYHYDSTVVNISNITDTLLSTGWLQPNTDYNWKVRVLGNNGIKGNWSSTFHFKTSDVSTAVPTLYAPYGGDDSDMYRMYLNWYCYNGESYRVQVSTDSTFRTSLAVDSTVNLSNMQVRLDFGQTYYWRVKQIWGDILFGWSNVGTFNTPQKIEFININKPQMFDVLMKGSIFTITWDDNTTTALKIFLYNNNSKVFELGITTGKSFDWLISQTLTENDKYQIVILDTISGYSNSSNFFSIVAPNIQVLSPNSNNKWVRGTTDIYITWNDNINSNLIILLYKAENLIDTIGVTESEYTTILKWNVPFDISTGNDYRVVIKEPISGVFGTSNSFSIMDPFISLTFPRPGDVLRRGSTQHLISWEDNIDKVMQILLYKGETLVNTLGFTENKYSHLFWWDISAATQPGNDFRIVVKDTATNTIGFSGYFTITWATAVNDPKNDESTCLIYPNPATDWLNIELNNQIYGTFRVSLYEITGRKIFSKELTGRQNRLNVRDLTRGIYLVEIEVDGKIFHKKIILRE